MKRSICAFTLLLVCAHASTESSHASHDHGDEHSDESHGGEHPEAAAVYDVEAGTNSLVVVPAEGVSEGEAVVFMVVPAISADFEGLEGAEEDAEDAWDAYVSGAEEPTTLTSGELLIPSAAEVFQIPVADPLVVVRADIATDGAFAVFTEHGSDMYTTSLVSPSGTVLVAGAQEGGESEEEEEDEEDEEVNVTTGKWLNAVVATLLISCCSFTGIILLVDKRVSSNIDLSYVFMLASGALLAAPLLHIIPESLEGLESKYDSLHDLGLYSGLAVMGGIAFGTVVHALMGSDHSHAKSLPLGDDSAATVSASQSSVAAPAAETGKTAAAAALSTALAKSAPAGQRKTLHTLIEENSSRSLFDLKGLQPVCWNVVSGDLVHNFADGVTIGAAFLSCTTGKGWIVTASTLLCEVPHELADFMALLNGGMSVKQAFGFNFLSALSAVLGAIVIMALGDSLTDAQVSIILLVGAGSFIFISLTELIPEALMVTDAARKRGNSYVMRAQVFKLASFTLGALLIGIPLIFDEHCGGAHDGHDH